jgi:hypothetical protein
MKKWIAGLVLALILTVSCVYLFIPSKIVISTIISSQATINGEFRYISSEEKWPRWWQDSDGKPHRPGDPFTYNETSFRLIKHSYNVVGIEIEQNGLKLPSIIHLVSFKIDSTVAIWQGELPAGKNPVTRIINYRKALEIRKNMNRVMKNLSSFISNSKNVYGVSITRTTNQDSTLLSARFISPAYPTTSELYDYFDAVRENIKKQKAKSTGYPMMNVIKLENDSFETEVAVPTSRELKNDGEFIFMRMIPGNSMMTEVTGGSYTANEALRQIELFIADYGRFKIANSFQSLLTNRLSEPDTLKWITKIYVPVVQ